MKKIKNILIVSRTWFDKVNGNSHYSAYAVIDGYASQGLTLVNLMSKYGHGSQIEDDMFAELDKLGYIKLERSEKGRTEAPFRYCDRMGIKKLVIDTPVAKQSLIKDWKI